MICLPLYADGSFDILRYADPDLDLGSDDKTIFDDLVDDTKPKEGDQKVLVPKKEAKEGEVKKEVEGKKQCLFSMS